MQATIILWEQDGEQDYITAVAIVVSLVLEVATLTPLSRRSKWHNSFITSTHSCLMREVTTFPATDPLTLRDGDRHCTITSHEQKIQHYDIIGNWQAIGNWQSKSTDPYYYYDKMRRLPIVLPITAASLTPLPYSSPFSWPKYQQ
eukprot:scaffold3792_cov160-Skeletonema_menzelii.AAC.19